MWGLRQAAEAAAQINGGEQQNKAAAVQCMTYEQGQGRIKQLIMNQAKQREVLQRGRSKAAEI